VAGTAAVGAPGVAAPEAAPSPPSTDISAPDAGTAPAYVCAPPPPSCPEGQSPQFTQKNAWECTDCALVVSYGSIYGNFRRCVNEPKLQCPDGQVPTWVFEDDQWECQWECQDTCDNGQYDQHTINGTTVCVPC
jgi:hypothetical protein